GRTFTVNGPATLTARSVTLSGSTWAGSGTLTNNAPLTLQNTCTISSPLIQGQTGSMLLVGNLTASAGFANAGSITLNNSSLTVSGGPLTNSGSLSIFNTLSQPQEVKADLVNDGTVTLAGSMLFDKAG